MTDGKTRSKRSFAPKTMTCSVAARTVENMWKRTCKEIYPAVRPGFLEFAKNYGAAAAMNSNAEGEGG